MRKSHLIDQRPQYFSAYTRCGQSVDVRFLVLPHTPEENICQVCVKARESRRKKR